MAQCYWYCNSAKAERELGWSARDVAETLRDTVDDLKARGVVPRKRPLPDLRGLVNARHR
jgi:hypothetical protein